MITAILPIGFTNDDDSEGKKGENRNNYEEISQHEEEANLRARIIAEARAKKKMATSSLDDRKLPSSYQHEGQPLLNSKGGASADGSSNDDKSQLFSDKNDKHQHIPSWLACLRRRPLVTCSVIAVCLVVFLPAMLGGSDWLPFHVVFHRATAAAVYEHKETLPTLLELIDPDKNSPYKYLFALDNELYNRIAEIAQEEASVSERRHVQSRIFTERPQVTVEPLDDEKMRTREKVFLDPEEDDLVRVKYGQPISIRYSMGLTHHGHPVASEESLLLLYCGPIVSSPARRMLGATPMLLEQSHALDPSTATLVEAATLTQVRATAMNAAAKHGHKNKLRRNSKDGFEEWLIPRFPIVRHEACQFVLVFDLEELRAIKRGSGLNLEQLTSLIKPHNDDDDSKLSMVQDQIAVSNVFRLSALSTPTSIHLALTNSSTEMLASFVTGRESGGGGTATLNGVPVVQYGRAQDDASNFALSRGTSTTYAPEDLCQAPANVTAPGKFQDPGWLHSVVMTNLLPNTNYKYRVGLQTGQGVTWSDTYTFWTAPASNDSSKQAAFSYLVYGDQGCPATGWTTGSEWVAAMATQELRKSEDAPLRAIHHFGDLSYAQGAGHIWDAWMEMLQPLTPYVPLMIAVGNHEYDHLSGGLDPAGNGASRDPSGVETDYGFAPSWGNFGDDSGGECGVPTSKRFTMPQSSVKSVDGDHVGQDVDSNGVFWYSYSYGGVFTIVLSSEHDMSHGSPQYNWLASTLADRENQRAVTPWIIVELHRPLYQSEQKWDNNNVGIAMRHDIEDLLRDYEVDLVLAGHYHSYLRSCPGLYRSRCDNGGPMHLTIGSAGAALDSENLYRNGWTQEFLPHIFGYGKITVYNSSALQFEFIKAGPVARATAGQVLDDVWIQK